MTEDLKQLIGRIKQFNEERDWDQFHHPKELAISIVLEASELLEHFQWKSWEEIDGYIKKHKSDISEEVADIFIYLLQMSDSLDIDIIRAAKDKIKKNAKKYPVEKAKGSAKKYTEL